MRRLFALAALLGSAAYGWESTCRVYPDVTAPAASLTNGAACSVQAAARNRWVGPNDEHRQLFEQSMQAAGVPASALTTLSLRVFTGPADVAVDGQQVPSLLPVPFDQASRAQTRSLAISELAQLPDFSYSLFDWAQGNETCPLANSEATAVECHDFATHMGPVNANHFLPLARDFYRQYHQLALDRARECGALQLRLGAAAARFPVYLLACEEEALALEAVGQHFLQDAWSMGHMWSRWGGPDLDGFPGATPEERREKAAVIALVTGLIHGSRSVLQKVPAWSSLDVNDALCAPHEAVGFGHPDDGLQQAVGDNYLAQITAAQSTRLHSCAVAGILEVYRAAGEQHGPAVPQGGLMSIAAGDDACFSQRATNRAMLTAAGVNLKIAGKQLNIPLDARTVGILVPTVASSAGDVPVSDATRNRFRLELMRLVSLARVLTAQDPEGTQMAEARLGSFLGAAPNSQAVKSPLASYVDPPLPWPAPASADPAQAARSAALARVFHRAHARDWCQSIDAAALEALKARAQNGAFDAAVRATACEVCTEFAVRQLRVGAPGSYDTAREPLCALAEPLSTQIYAAGTAAETGEQISARWCGCP